MLIFCLQFSMPNCPDQNVSITSHENVLILLVICKMEILIHFDTENYRHILAGFYILKSTMKLS